MYELQEKLETIFDWDDSFFVYLIKLNGIEETTESIALSHPDQLFRLGQVIEERTQDLCEHNLEILLSAISCYAQINQTSPNYTEANQKICRLIETLLENQKNHEYSKQLLSELVCAFYKLQCYEKAAPYLLVLHQINQSETQKAIKPLLSKINKEKFQEIVLKISKTIIMSIIME